VCAFEFLSFDAGMIKAKQLGSNPIRKVLSSMQTHRVRALLMGEQAEDRKYWLPLRAELERLRHRR
jgi:hypothetical protein